MANPLLNKILQKKNAKKTVIALGGAGFGVIILLLIVSISHRNAHLVTLAQSNVTPANIEPFQKIAEFSQSATGEAISNLQTSESMQSQQITNLAKENKQLTSELKTIGNPVTTQNPIANNKFNMAPPQSININKTNLMPSVQNTTSPNVQNTSPEVVNLSQSQNLNALPISPDINNVSRKTFRPGIADFSFSYDGNNTATQDNAKCTPKNCILPGTFARAVLLGAADADASVNGQSNTTPILFRVLGRGILPNGYHSHLKGCFVVGEVYGDVSSGRGEVKLAQISCIIKGKTISRSINGEAFYLGKEGIYGNTITRNGPMLWNAALSGMLSGLAQGAQQAQQTQSISPLGTTTSVPPSRLAMSMRAGGVQ
ncbi:MAG: hypothetical protein NTU49_06810 [Gammaproteobacteria bacterium]|nr:hypothetical protein [Gammaproteobacteria bacterium]